VNVTSGERKAMLRALRLAREGWPSVFPNPMVGAVVLDSDGNPVGEAHHECCGGRHAEVMAIDRAEGRLDGATLVVTLEPCAHQGKTPPCVETVAASGVKRVVAAMVDPDPRVSGRGVTYLKEHGIHVEVGLFEEQARDLNRVWVHCMSTRRSFLHLKMAVSLDGRAAASDGSSRWITGAASRERVHEMRSRAHAVMVGGGTALRDNPTLSTGKYSGHRPVRVIVTEHALPEDLTVYKDGNRTITAISAGCDWAPPGEAIVFNDLAHLLQLTLSLDLGLVLCEGGPGIATALVNEGLVDRISVFTAPKLLGGGGIPVFRDLWVTDIGSAVNLENTVVEVLGEDTLVEGKLVYRSY